MLDWSVSVIEPGQKISKWKIQRLSIGGSLRGTSLRHVFTIFPVPAFSSSVHFEMFLLVSLIGLLLFPGDKG